MAPHLPQRSLTRTDQACGGAPGSRPVRGATKRRRAPVPHIPVPSGAGTPLGEVGPLTLPEEFADVLAGTVTVPDPAAVAAPAEPVAAPPPAPQQVEEPRAVEVPTPGRGAPRMGPEATDLPPLDLPDLPELGAGTGLGTARDLRLLAAEAVALAVELGRVKLPLRELLALGPGAVLELDRAADAPVDVLVNGCLVARGEVVVIDGDFGVRVTAVVER